MANSNDVKERNELNKELLNSFKETFDAKNTHECREALSYPFDKLYAISDLSSKDQDFRIITWELESENSEIKYYGIVSYIFDNQNFTDILTDSSDLLSKWKTFTPNSWYGAMYYDLKVFNYRNQNLIVLLGIDRSKELVKQKVIEVIEFSENLKFGAEVFDDPEEKNAKRKIYTYAVEADMSIWFDLHEDKILLDHLSPLSDMHRGKYEYYVPDLSFDSFTFKKGLFHYKGDVDARMDKNLKDRYFEMELPKQEKVY